MIPMTFKEKLKREHPELVNEDWYGGVHGCPSNHEYEAKKPCGSSKVFSGDIACSACWNREIPEELITDKSDKTRNIIIDRRKQVDEEMQSLQKTVERMEQKIRDADIKACCLTHERNSLDMILQEYDKEHGRK